MSHPLMRWAPSNWSLQARVAGMATAVTGFLTGLLGLVVLVAAPPEPRAGNAEAILTLVVLLGLCVSLLLVAWLAGHTVRRALRPVRTMSAELGGIEGRPGRARVTVPGGDDEVAELGRAVNVTLARMERLDQRRRAFVADASHELRSPLTGLRTQLELALEHPDAEDWPTVAKAALGDAERLQRLIRDLLIMARLEAGSIGERARVDLGELVRAETARRSGRVPIELRTDEDVVVSGNRDHLVRVLTNLLDNADRYARSRVRVAVVSDGRNALMMVADDGPGIPPEERERVFQRFQRLAEDGHGDEGGTGLGLPISRDIAAAHGGSLVVGDGPDGARLVLHLPLA